MLGQSQAMSSLAMLSRVNPRRRESSSAVIRSVPLAPSCADARLTLVRRLQRCEGSKYAGSHRFPAPSADAGGNLTGLELKAMLKRKSDPWDREVEFARAA